MAAAAKRPNYGENTWEKLPVSDGSFVAIAKSDFKVLRIKMTKVITK